MAPLAQPGGRNRKGGYLVPLNKGRGCIVWIVSPIGNSLSDGKIHALEYLLRTVTACLMGGLLLGGLPQLQQAILRTHVRHGGWRPGSTPGGELR